MALLPCAIADSTPNSACCHQHLQFIVALQSKRGLVGVVTAPLAVLLLIQLIVASEIYFPSSINCLLQLSFLTQQ